MDVNQVNFVNSKKRFSDVYLEYIYFTCVLVSPSVCAVNVVGLVDWESVGRDMVGRDMVGRGMLNWDVLDRDGVGWELVDGSGVGRLMVMVGTRVLRGGGAGLVRPRVVWEPGGVGQVLQVPPSK